MESVSWMSDYLAVHMLAMAQVEERRFEDCLLSCPKTGDGVIKIFEPEVFTRLLEYRITSLLLSLAALESYLCFYAHETANKIEANSPGITLKQYMEKNGLLEFFKTMPNRIKRRHELIMEENGDRPIKRFLTIAALSLDEKVMYWVLIRTGKMLNYKEGYVKKMMGIMKLRAELLQPGFDIAPEAGKVADREQLKRVFLHHDLPPAITPGRSCSDQYLVEHYNEGHFLWELLHCYPTRVVQEVIQYFHLQDNSENHFICAIYPQELVDSEGIPVTEPAKRYRIEVNLEG